MLHITYRSIELMKNVKIEVVIPLIIILSGIPHNLSRDNMIYKIKLTENGKSEILASFKTYEEANKHLEYFKLKYKRLYKLKKLNEKNNSFGNKIKSFCNKLIKCIF